LQVLSHKDVPLLFVLCCLVYTALEGFVMRKGLLSTTATAATTVAAAATHAAKTAA
jgi:hypothetical protein